MNIWVGATTHEESMISRTLLPTSLYVEIKGVLFHCCVCKRPEREVFMLRGILGMFSWCERKGESSSLGVCAKIKFLWFYSYGFGKREKIRKKLFFSLSFFYLFISSRSPSSISRKILKIWRKDPDQPRRRSSHELALPRRSIRSKLRVNFS